MATFEVDSWVWITDEAECFLPARVKVPFRPGEDGRVQTEDGEDYRLSGAQTQFVIACNPEVLRTNVDNLINLNDLNENAILHNLRIRYKEDLIYTYVSSILISVNPFKLLPLYTPEMLERYRTGARDKPPHIFAIAYNAHSNMISESKNQSVIISGESGAGKSEATKLILQFLADVSSRAGGSANTGNLEQQVLSANPIMEAFGNAKTVRNNNSSRFGKLITVRFDRNGTITGGLIINYLLEKSRVVHQMAGERNYHIFYQILAGCEADQALKRELQVDSPEMFNYTNQSGVIYIDGISDEKEFEEVRTAMDTLNISRDDQMAIFRTTAGVLQFGNVRIIADHSDTHGDDNARIDNPEQLAKAAQLWGVTLEDMDKALTTRNIGTRSTILVNYNVAQALDARDAMVKRTYAMMFEFIISKINQVLEHGADARHTYIGVLDIFGFESFENNSFEQLCINYCNEKLQFHFNEHIFKLEQDVYAAEGVHVPQTAFKDNQPTLDLIEIRGDGILSMIDDEINVPKGTDDTFLSKLKQKHNKHPNFATPKPKDVADHTRCFGVAHYAGVVFYNVSGFLEKNKDVLHPDIVGVLRTSSYEFIRNLYPVEEAPAAAANPRAKSRAPTSKAQKKTLGAQFKDQLAALMETLNATFPHFVRCMKPNDSKVGDMFTAQRMLDQLRYAGLLEVCRIRKLGYPTRRDFDEFYKRYRCIVPGTTNIRSLLEGLEQSGILVSSEWARGTTKVFMRTPQATILDVAREQAYARHAKRVQKVARGFIARGKFKQWKRILDHIRRAMFQRKEDDLNHWIDMSAELPHGGRHLQLVRDAKVLKTRLAEERRIKNLLTTAIANRDMAGLRAAVQAAESMAPPLDSELVPQAKALIARLEEEQRLKEELTAAINARSKPKIVALLAKALDMDLDCDEVRQAVALKARLDEEEEAVEMLVQAMHDRNIHNLAAFIQKCQELGLDIPEVERARALLQRIQAENAAKAALSAAVADRQLEPLIAALEKAHGLLDDSVAEVVAARALRVVMENENRARAQLMAAVDSRDLGTLDAALAAAAALSMTPDKFPEISSAQTVRETVLTEMRALDALRAAVAANDPDQLNAALREASRLGLTGPDVDAARQASQKLGAQSELRTKLSMLAASDNLDALNAALEEARNMSMLNTPEADAVLATRDRLLEENRLMQELDAAVRSNNYTDISRAVTNCMRLNLATKYPVEIARAKEVVSRLGEQTKIAMQLATATKARDLDAIIAGLARAAEFDVAGEEVHRAQELRAELETQNSLLDALSAALTAKDINRLNALIDRAAAIHLHHDKVQQAKIMRDREMTISRTKANLEQACANEDLTGLQDAIEAAIQLGLEAEEVNRAQVLRERLLRLEAAKNDVTACHRALEAKALSPSGITAADLEPVTAALERAKNAGVPATAPELEIAAAFRDKMEQQLRVQEMIQTALQTQNREELKQAVESAEDMELGLESVAQSKALLKAIEAERRANEQATGPDNITDADFERMENERRERQQKARHDRFKFTNYQGLRSGDDFAKGVILNKKKVKEGMLKWQNTSITKSLLDLDKELSKRAIEIHKDLLGYMGDKTMNFPATLAQDILQKGFEHPDLRDEIYMQIMKQLTGNPRPESIAKGWQVMCMCVSTFPPSLDFENYLLNFILEKKESKGAVRNYAKYCLRTLEGMLSSGESSGFVPSVEEIQAYKERPPILATIELVDGQVLTEDLPVTPDLNVGKVLEICSGWLQLKDSRSDTMGIFVYDVEGESEDAAGGQTVDPYANAPYADLPRTPRPLRNDDYMGDVIVQKARQKRNFKFVLKKKIFLHEHAGHSEDPMYSRLVYLQAEDEVLAQGNVPIDAEDAVVQLAALSIAVAYGEDFPRALPSILELDLLDFIIPTWRDRQSVEDWGRKILAKRAAVVALEPEELQNQFVDLVKDNPMYGTHFFYVHKVNNSPRIVERLPVDLIIAFNADGMHIFDSQRRLLQSFGYADIYRWGGSSSQFSLIIWDQSAEDTFELILTTSQAADMAAIILDHIKAIMALQGA